MHVFVLGCPSEFGGADTELWHTVQLWRRHNVDVTLIPTWKATPAQREKLDAIGARTLEVEGSAALENIPELRGAIVVGFCNGEYLKCAPTLVRLECKTVWVNCMTWVFPAEKRHYEQYGPFSAYVFQSEYQQTQISKTYRAYGASPAQFHRIRGAFSLADFPFQPSTHRLGESFYYGRIARNDLDKWSSNLWPIYAAVRYRQKRARVMAWDDKLTKKCGAPPDWVEALTAHAETALKFLRSLHCLFPINGGARENWPRAGLEAMAAGVPIVAQREWGWCEMIEHGVTGFLGADDFELAHYAAVLAYDEELRQHIACNARRRLETELANADDIWLRWRQLFDALAHQRESNTKNSEAAA